MALICFDLDGPILDPTEGLHASLERACAELGLPTPGVEALRDRMGLDLRPLAPAPRADEALALCWRYFEEEGLFAQRVMEGAHLLLARLKRQGHRLHLLASQPAPCARKALHQFDLNLIFDGVTGFPPGEGWRSKQSLMAPLREDGVLRGGGILVGDRGDDLQAAAAHGLRAVGVAFGFGGRAELEGEQPEAILDSVPALDAWLEKTLRGPEIHDPFSRSE